MKTALCWIFCPEAYSERPLKALLKSKKITIFEEGSNLYQQSKKAVTVQITKKKCKDFQGHFWSLFCCVGFKE